MILKPYFQYIHGFHIVHVDIAFVMRLNPLVPFELMNLACSMTNLSLKDYAISCLGTMPVSPLERVDNGFHSVVVYPPPLNYVKLCGSYHIYMYIYMCIYIVSLYIV